MDGSGERFDMGTVLEDVTSETVDATHVRRRVDDWVERVIGLFAAIGEWLPDGGEARRGRPSNAQVSEMEIHLLVHGCDGLKVAH